MSKPRLYLPVYGCFIKGPSTLGDYETLLSIDLDYKDFGEYKDIDYKNWEVSSVEALKRIIKAVEPDIYFSCWFFNHFLEVESIREAFNFWDITGYGKLGLVPIKKNRSHSLNLMNHIWDHKNFVVINDKVYKEHFAENSVYIKTLDGLTDRDARKAIALFD